MFSCNSSYNIMFKSISIPEMLKNSITTLPFSYLEKLTISKILAAQKYSVVHPLFQAHISRQFFKSNALCYSPNT